MTSPVLIVDDEPMVLNILCDVFKRKNLNVFQAENGIDGWDIITKERIDLLISDIAMPGLDGCKLAKRVRKHSPNTRIALITGGHAENGMKLKNEGVIDYLFEKPFAVSSICKLITK